jgi:hypothetical protein
MNNNQEIQAAIADCRDLVNQAENVLMMFIEKKVSELGTIDFPNQDTLLTSDPRLTIIGLAMHNDAECIVTYSDVGETAYHELNNVNVHDLIYCAEQIEEMYIL